ncbi:MAG: phosphatidate cytidylyltransferase [Ignavibacteria bacterium]|jgi:phosphatidate cytidylyltransferase|nr:phosphatidate cytidylyltransferase [Ignavibacteria bacterium]MCU7504178.1 phosphatidate cytidylyltransferase [Ignavibacteria bacterium]MCU7516372.1 phosphatidate cytidylyltransferase [Ignavibacteria bacterium]
MSLGNTTTRILVSVAAIPLILLACYFGGLFFLLFIAAIGAVAFWEFSRMARNKNAFASDVIGLIAVLLIITNAYFHFMDFKSVVYLMVVLLLIYELFRNKSSAIFNLGTTLIGIFYIGLFSSSMVEIREYFPVNYQEGGFLMISILVSIWVCDSAAFFAGSALGKHKLFPRVSPKKSWEGAIAGFAAAVIAMVVMKILLLQFISIPDAAVIGLIVGTVGQTGDLTESLLKRDAGVKDSSNIIPGHGGIFDRFDSLLLTSPVVYLYLVYFVK